MNNLRLCFLFLLGSVLCPAMIVAQGPPPASPAAAIAAPSGAKKLSAPSTPEEFFARARRWSDLIAAGAPFHLKATYIATGDAEFIGSGTFEEWWQWKDLWRKQVTLGNYRYVLVRNGYQLAEFATGAYIPLRLRQATAFTLVNVADNAGLGGGWTLAKTEEGSQTLNVAESKTACFSKNKKSPLCDLKFEFTDDGVLRLRHYNRVTTVYNHLQQFDGQLIPREILVAIGNQLSLKIDITTLEQLSTPDKNIFDTTQKPANLISLPLVPMDPELLKRAKIQKVKCKNCMPPPYPTIGGYRTIEGSVMADVSVDETGKVREPFILVSGGDLLDQVTLHTVRQWQFTPFKINGAARMAERYVPENFSLKNY